MARRARRIVGLLALGGGAGLALLVLLEREALVAQWHVYRLRSDDPEVREEAVGALGRLGSETAVDELERLAREDRSLRGPALHALRGIRGAGFAALVRLLGSEDESLREKVEAVLEETPPPLEGLLARLAERLERGKTGTFAATRVFATLVSKRTAEEPAAMRGALLRLLDIPEPLLRRRAFRTGLLSLGLNRSATVDAVAAPVVLRALADPSPAVRAYAAALAGHLGRARECYVDIVDALVKSLEDETPEVRTRAVRSLLALAEAPPPETAVSRLGPGGWPPPRPEFPPRAVEAAAALSSDEDGATGRAAAQALLGLDPERFRALLRGGPARARTRAVEVLAYSSSPELRAELVAIVRAAAGRELDDTRAELVAVALRGLVWQGDVPDGAVPAAAALLRHPRRELRWRAATALGDMGALAAEAAPELAAAVEGRLAKDDMGLRQRAARALGHIGSAAAGCRAARDALVEALAEPELAGFAVDALKAVTAPVEALAGGLRSEDDPLVRAAAIEALGGLLEGDDAAGAREALVEALDDPEVEVRLAALAALEEDAAAPGDREAGRLHRILRAPGTGPEERFHAAVRLVRAPDAPAAAAVEHLADFAADTEWVAADRQRAIEALGRAGEPGRRRIVPYLDADEALLRRAACEALGETLREASGIAPAVLERLEALRDDPAPAVRRAARAALETIDRDSGSAPEEAPGGPPPPGPAGSLRVDGERATFRGFRFAPAGGPEDRPVRPRRPRAPASAPR